MAQFRVYENSNCATKQRIPYLLDMQPDLLDDLQTTVVIPLVLKSTIGKAAMTKLCPLLEIEEREFVVLTSQIAGVDRKVSGKEIGNFSHYQAEVIAAVDFLISGI
jgi:toxin CcdB